MVQEWGDILIWSRFSWELWAVVEFSQAFSSLAVDRKQDLEIGVSYCKNIFILLCHFGCLNSWEKKKNSSSGSVV